MCPAESILAGGLLAVIVMALDMMGAPELPPTNLVILGIFFCAAYVVVIYSIFHKADLAIRLLKGFLLSTLLFAVLFGMEYFSVKAGVHLSRSDWFLTVMFWLIFAGIFSGDSKSSTASSSENQEHKSGT